MPDPGEDVHPDLAALALTVLREQAPRIHWRVCCVQTEDPAVCALAWERPFGERAMGYTVRLAHSHVWEMRQQPALARQAIELAVSVSLRMLVGQLN